VLLVVSGHDTTAAFGLMFGLTPWIVAVLSFFGRRTQQQAQRAAPPAPLSRPLSLLVVSALAAQLLINAGPLVVSLLATDATRGTAGVYLAALVVVRIPVFLFTAVQPSFLPALAAHLAQGNPDAFVRLLRTVLLSVCAGSAVVCLAAGSIGPAAVSWLFDFDEQLGRGTLFLLAVAVALFLIATTLAQGLLGLGHHAWVATGWLLGIVGLAVGTTLGSSVVARATNGLLAGAAVATIAFGWLLLRGISEWRAALRAPEVVGGRALPE
jgi:O-antigen/teichoic acid export membrane protein